MIKFENNSETAIMCPNCVPPVKLIVKTNHLTEHQFLGCPNYPECTYTTKLPQEWIMKAQGQPQLFGDTKDE